MKRALIILRNVFISSILFVVKSPFVALVCNNTLE